MTITVDNFPLAAGFISPWFFWAGLAAVSIPIIIHLLNRRRFKVVRWAAMEYLLQAMRKNRRRLKFEQWLLLAVRCLLMLLIGLALARPLGCESNSLASLVGQRNGLHVFVIDNSYSMAFEAERPGAKTHLDQAKLMAKGMMGRLIRGGESVVVITAAQPATAVIAKPTYSLDACYAAIDGIEQSYGSTDLAGAMGKAIEVARAETKQPNKTLYLLTDGTRSAFEGAQAEAIKNAARDVAGAFGDASHFHLFNLGRQGQWNQALVDLKPTSPLITTKFSADFAATPRGYGNVADAILQWQVDEKDVAGNAALKPDAATPPSLLSNRAMKEGGPHVVSATLVGDDRLKVDNGRYRVVNVSSEIPVLIVDGERSTQGLGGASAFLEQALAPQKLAAEGGATKTNSPFAPRVISDQDLGEREVLSQWRAVLFTNVSRVPENVADQLEAYVEQGGVVGWFMGPKVDGDEYNRVLLGGKRKLLPGKLAEKLSATAVSKDAFLFDFKPEGDLSTYLAVFKGEANSGLGTARVFQYWRLAVSDPTTERVLNYLPAGQSQGAPTSGPASKDAVATEDPAITVHTVGKGRVIFFSTTANADWTSFPAKPAYLTLMQELLGGTISSGDAWMNVSVGDPLVVPGSIGMTAAPTLTDGAKRDVPVQAITNAAGEQVYQSQPLRRPGVYRLSTGSQVYPIAVNVPADEADVRTLPEAALRKALGDVEFTAHEDQAPAESASLNANRDLGWSVMLLVLALAGFECFMAMRFGHYRRAGRSASAPVAA